MSNNSNLRKFLAGSVTAAVVASAMTPAVSADEKVNFTDVNASGETYDAISTLVDLGVIQGYPDGTFKPNQQINRGQAAEMLVKAIADVEPKTEGLGNVFTDLNENSYYAPYAEAIADAAIINGYPDGSFGAGNQLTREQMAKIIVNAFGLEDNGTDVEIKDLAKVSEGQREYVKILAQHGVTILPGGEFSPKDTVKRSQFALFVYRAMIVAGDIEVTPEVTEIKAVDSTTLHVTFKGELTEVNTEDFQFDNGLEVKEAKIVTGDVEASEATTLVELKTSEQEAGKDYTLSYKGEEVEGAVVEGFTPVAPEVTSVTAVDAKSITLTFNKAIDADTLKNAGTDVITLVNGEGALNPGVVKQELSEDGKTLTLKATDIFKGDYTVKVPFEIVKDVDGLFVKPVNQKVTVNDTTAPVLTSADALIKDVKDGIKTITLTFNEEIKSIDTVKIGSSNYAAVVSGNQATIAVDLDATKSYDVTVVNATDTADNVKDIQVASVNVAVDNVAPSITKVEATGENTVKVTLDEELAGDTLTITGKVGTFVANVVDSAVVNPDNKKEYTLSLDKDYLFKNGNADTVTLTVAKDALVDALGNKNAEETTKTVSVSKDVTAPAVTNVETSTTDGKVTAFTLTYSEDVVTPDTTKISVVNSKGEILSQADVIDTAVVSDDNKVVFTLKAGLTAEEYSFELAEGFVVDTALTPIKSAKYSFTVDVKDPAKPVETSFIIEDATEDANVITVDFGAKVKATGTASALNPAAYQVNGVALPADTEIAFVDNAGVIDQTQVVITLPEGFVTADDTNAIFRVTGVETLDNKVSAPFMTTVDIEDNTAPVATSFVATDLDEVTVTYSEAIAIADAAVITDEIKLFNSEGTAIEVTGYEVTAEGKLVLTIADASKVAKLTTVETADTADIKDIKGNVQKVDVTVNK